jgi:hypothetical protein
MPIRVVFVPSGSSPLVKIGTILSYSLIFLVSMPFRLPEGTIFLSIQYSESSMSKLVGWVTARLTTSSEVSVVNCSSMPRSAFTLSEISLNAFTPVPA